MRTDSCYKAIFVFQQGLQMAEVELPFFLQLFPDLIDAFCILIEKIENETLEVRCTRNVHRGTGGSMRLCRTSWPIDPGAEEFFEHIVFIGSQNQTAYRQTHLSSHMAGQNIAKITRRTAKRNLL